MDPSRQGKTGDDDRSRTLDLEIEKKLRALTSGQAGLPGYESWIQARVHHEEASRFAMENLEKRLEDGPKKRLLDLGCGVGGLVAARAARGRFSVGLDPFPSYLDIARLRLTRRGGPGYFALGLGEALPFRTGAFDLVTALDVLEHSENPLHILEEIRRVLKPGGRAYLIVVARYGFWDEHYNLPFINWLPRFLGSPLARWLRPSKPSVFAGRQALADMHYFSFGQFRSLAARAGFSGLQDLREERLLSRDFPPGLRGRAARAASACGLALPGYRLARAALLRSFPVSLRRS